MTDQMLSGFKAVLSWPWCYRLLQNLLGAEHARTKLSIDYFDLPHVRRVLDIGCGTADILDVLPGRVEYLGFDASAAYIAYAKHRYAHRNASFFAKRLTDADSIDLGHFDLVIAFGVLHHLNNEEASSLFALAAKRLACGGALCTLDPCKAAGQGRVARMLVNSDRGKHVREPEGYADLARSVFEDVAVFHRTDLLRVPYDHTVMLCRPTSPSIDPI